MTASVKKMRFTISNPGRRQCCRQWQEAGNQIVLKLQMAAVSLRTEIRGPHQNQTCFSGMATNLPVRNSQRHVLFAKLHSGVLFNGLVDHLTLLADLHLQSQIKV